MDVIAERADTRVQIKFYGLADLVSCQAWLVQRGAVEGTDFTVQKSQLRITIFKTEANVPVWWEEPLT